jgi:hypothetical protein
MSNCDVHAGSRLPAEAIDTPIQCRCCGARVPASTLVSLEGEDYVWNFCGPDCLAQWCDKVGHAQRASPPEKR